MNRVDPSVREMAELVRGGGRGETTINNVHPSFNIYEVNDGEATAERVMNRLAVAMT